MRLWQPFDEPSRDNWPLQFIAMISAGDKKTRSLSFIETEDRERKLLTVGTSRHNKMPPTHAGDIKIERKMWCFAHCSTYLRVTGDLGGGIAVLRFAQVCASLSSIRQYNVPDGTIAFLDGRRPACWIPLLDFPQSLSSFDGSIASFCEVIGAFCWCDCLDELADGAPSLFDGSTLCVSHPMFDFGKGLLDRIEIG
ncbi:hypothetical protein X737_35305 [Mesorhizobium sp. L48C026A00]|nr:hypothetical protein X737_35305 [Mesorhizobium sp. L48C026A00]